MIIKKGLTNLREHLGQGGQVELSLGCYDIPKMDLMSPSDPFCVIYVRNASGWEKIGTTETFQDTFSCKWAWKLYLDEILACSELKFEVYDRDSHRDVLKDHDFIGYVEGKQIVSMLEQRKDYQRIDIIREDKKKSRGSLSLTLDWIEKPVHNFDVVFDVSVDCHPRRNLYYHVLRKCCSTSQYILVLSSDVIDKKSCRFEESKLSLMQLGATTRALRIELFRGLSIGKSKSLGFIKTSVDELLKAGLNTPLVWTACEKNGLQNPRVSVTQEGESSESLKRFFIHISG